jgi:hypothetical protein
MYNNGASKNREVTMSTRLDFPSTQQTNLQSNTSGTQSNTNGRSLPIDEVYTGTKEQPDVVSVFFKPNGSEIFIADEQLLDDLGHSPFEFMSAVRRIRKAVAVLFQELKQGTLFDKNSESWNALKNLSRGVIQLVPLLGSAVLYTYDLARIHMFVHPEIKSALSNREGSLLGIAFDGKPIFTVPLSLLCQNRTKTPTETLTLLQYIWLSMIINTHENKNNRTRREIAELMASKVAQWPIHRYI